MLVYNTNQCRDVQDWFAWYAAEFKVPLLGIHTHRGVKDVGDAHVASIASQMKALIPQLEAISGNKFDIDKLRQVLALSRECSTLWKKVLDTASAEPLSHHFF